ncbi:hypothetical protein XU18_1936 [Perkinsela sp. CCAP 1560/4]|nr:hypothetical protein XU18_1936 [Perkinsela sp. CCAP 1560/4]|eukprot:KNH07404.1 hypothetical protein XU18_1936 [Perkinsela sp. CCAP 1560/4]
METVRVAVRIRPLVSKEIQEGAQTCCLIPEEDCCQIFLGDRSFTFDNVFSPSCGQFDVYSACCTPLLRSFLDGFNCTIFAYGQTGSGKTYSVEGIIENFVPSLFDALKTSNDDGKQSGQSHDPQKEVDFTIRISAMEIHNDVIRDLLAASAQTHRSSDLLTSYTGDISLKDSRQPEDTGTDQSAKSAKNLSIREGINGIVSVVGLSELVVNNAVDVFQIIEEGLATRTVGGTRMNEESSRSHAVITVTLEQRRIMSTDLNSDIPETIISKFRIVDLAGSERQKKTGATGFRLKESIHINSGLLSLGNVISCLCEQEEFPGRRIHVPYRDSKLTRVLQDSLGGNSVTVMLACISPADSNFEETLNTLKYANRAKNIRNKPIRNLDPHIALIQELRKELAAAKALLSQHGIPFSCDAEMAPSRGTAKSNKDPPRPGKSSSHKPQHDLESPVIVKCTALIEECMHKLPSNIQAQLAALRKKSDFFEKLKIILRWAEEISLRVDYLEEDHIQRLESQRHAASGADIDGIEKVTSPLEGHLSSAAGPGVAEEGCTTPDFETISRERADIVNERLDLTARRRALQIERDNYERKQEYDGITLEEMDAEIKSREKIIHELVMREYEAQRILEEYSENIHLMESERNQAQSDLAKAMKQLDARSLTKDSIEARRLQSQADTKIRQLESSIGDLRRKHSQAENEVRRQKVEKDQIRKLSVELNKLREQHEMAHVKIREATLRSVNQKKKSAEKEKFLIKQLESIENRNMLLLRSLDKKDAEIKRMRLVKQRSSPPHPTKGRKFQATSGKTTAESDEAECRRSNTKYGIDTTLDLSALDGKRRTEEHKIRDLRAEREDAVVSRDELARKLATFQSETKEQIKKSLIGWSRRITELSLSIDSVQEGEGQDTDTESEVMRLHSEKEQAELSHAQVLNYAQTHEQSLLDGIRKTDDSIDSLDASIAFHVNRYYLFSQQLKRCAENAE